MFINVIELTKPAPRNNTNKVVICYLPYSGRCSIESHLYEPQANGSLLSSTTYRGSDLASTLAYATELLLDGYTQEGKH